MNTQLTDLMQKATENLEPVSTDLLERSVQQGLRLRRRRTTILTASGAGAVLATAGLIAGGLQLFDSPSSSPAVAGTPVPLTPSVKPNHVTPQQTLATLRSLIKSSGRTLSGPEAWGESSEGFVAAAYVVNDGKGASRIEVMLSGPGQQGPGCDDTSSCTRLPDGSTLEVLTQQPEYPDSRNKVNGVFYNSASLRLADGRYISITNYNAPAEKDKQHTRATPLFTTSQLTAMAKSKSWKFPPASTMKSGKAVPPSSKVKPTK